MMSLSAQELARAARRKSTKVVLSWSGFFVQRRAKQCTRPQMGNGYVEIASPVPLPVGRRNNFKGGSQPPFFFVGLAVGLARRYDRCPPFGRLRRSRFASATTCGPVTRPLARSNRPLENR